MELLARSLLKRDPGKVHSGDATNARRCLRGGIARGTEKSGHWDENTRNFLSNCFDLLYSAMVAVGYFRF